MADKDRSKAPAKPASHGMETLMHVTSFKSWMTLWGIGGVLAGVIVWSIFGTLPERIDGQGLLRGEGGLQQITASGSGRITRLDLKINDVVAIDQVVGGLSAATVDENVRAAQARYDEALRQYEMDRSSDERAISDLRSEQTRKQTEMKNLEAIHQQRQDSFNRQLIPKSSLDNAKRDLDFAINDLAGLTDRIRSRQTNISRSAGRVASERIELERQLSTAAEVSQVKSSVAGRVINIVRKPGDIVRPGEMLAEVESIDRGTGLEVVAFVSAKSGKKVVPGQPVLVTVAGVPPEEHGMLRGRVKTVSEFPVAPDVVARTMQESSITDASYEVAIAPEADPGTPSRFAWTNGVGPADPVRSGTRVTIAVEVSAKAPITLVLPVKKQPPTSVQGAGATPPGS